MKRLRKFNENASQIDYKFIYDCFAELIDELIDDDKVEIKEIENSIAEQPFDHYIVINLKKKPANPAHFKRIYNIEESKLFDYINDIKSNNKILQEVEVALNILSEKYPEYRVSFDVDDYSISIKIFGAKPKRKLIF